MRENLAVVAERLKTAHIDEQPELLDRVESSPRYSLRDTYAGRGRTGIQPRMTRSRLKRQSVTRDS